MIDVCSHPVTLFSNMLDKITTLYYGQSQKICNSGFPRLYLTTNLPHYPADNFLQRVMARINVTALHFTLSERRYSSPNLINRPCIGVPVRRSSPCRNPEFAKLFSKRLPIHGVKCCLEVGINCLKKPLFLNKSIYRVRYLYQSPVLVEQNSSYLKP